MKDDEVNTAIENAKCGARENFASHGKVNAVFLIFKASGYDILAPWGLSKEQMAHALRYRCKEVKARGVLHIDEIWMAYETELKEGQKPSECPTAKEYVFLGLQDIRLGIKLWIAEIQRAKGKAILGEFLEIRGDAAESITEISGVFSDILSNSEAS